jgi:hypothetical protein
MRWKDTTSRVVVSFLLVVGDVLVRLVDFLAHVANNHAWWSQGDLRADYVRLQGDADH